MSGAGVVGVSVGAVVGGSVWLAGRGVQAGALVAARSVDLLGAGLVAVGERAQRNLAAWETEHAALREWETAARQVIELNARIDVLRAHAPDDLADQVPDPLRPCTETPAELAAWCATARTTIEALEQDLTQRTATAALSVLRQTIVLARPVTAQEAFDRYHEALADDATRGRATPPDALADVSRILDRLTPDVSAEDRADVLAAAAQVAVPRPDVDHHTLLDELRFRVQRAGERARARQADAVTAARMLQAIPADATSLRTELSAVVAGRRALDDDLRTRGAQAVEQVRDELEREYVRASVADTLAALGYEIDGGFTTVTGHPDRMRLVRPDWSAHAVQVVVDGEEVRTAVIRLADKAGADARREDVEREEQWCADQERLQEVLGESGLHVVERTLVPPGERVLPVAKRVERQAAEPVARERDR